MLRHRYAAGVNRGMAHSEDDFEVVLEKSNRLQFLLLILVTAIAAGLRFYRLGYWSFWIDEIHTITNSLSAYNGNGWPQPSMVLTGFVITTHGMNEWSSRIVPAVIGILTVPVLYFPIKRLFGPLVALISVLLLAISPWHLYWSQSSRFYTALLLFYMLASLWLCTGVAANRPRYMIFSALLLFLAIVERYIALFLVPVIMLYGGTLFARRLRSPDAVSFTPSVRFAFPLVVVFVAWMLLDPDAISRIIQKFFGHSNQGPIPLLFAITNRIGIPLTCLAAVGSVYILSKHPKTGLFITLGAIVPVILLLAIAPFAFTVDRYVFATLPNWTILGAVTVKELFDQTKGHGKLIACGVLLVLLTDAVVQDVLYFEYQNGNRHDWRGAVAMIAQHRRDGELIVTNRPELVTYYLGHQDDNVIETKQFNLQQMVQPENRIWLIENNDLVHPSLHNWVQENCTLFDVRDLHVHTQNLIMRVYLCEPFADQSSSSTP